MVASGVFSFLNKFSINNNITTLYHDFSGRQNALLAEYFDNEIDEISERNKEKCSFEIITPRDKTKRGAQLSILVHGEARKLFDDANRLIDRIINDKLITAKGVVGIFPANSIGDDITIYDVDNNSNQINTFFTLRQQNEKQSNDIPNIALSDYIAPKESGIKDYIGGFIVTAGIGAKEYSEKLKKTGDEYGAAMVWLLAFCK